MIYNALYGIIIFIVKIVIKVSRTAKLITFATASAITMAFDAAALALLTSRQNNPTAWVIYGMAIGLSVLLLAGYLIFKKQLHKAAKEKLFSGEFFERLKNHKFIGKIISDYTIRTLVTTFITLVWNVFYTFYLVSLASYYQSTWYASLVGFYATLVLMRGGIVLAGRMVVKRYGYLPSKISKIIFAITGGVLVALGGVIVAPVVEAAIGTYPAGDGSVFELVINLIPAVIKMSSAIIQFVRSTRKKSFVAVSIRNIGLVSAMMSLMLLNVTILRANLHGQQLADSIAAFGALFSALTIAAGVAMIVIGIRSIKKANALENVMAEPNPEPFPLLPGKEEEEEEEEEYDSDELDALRDLDKPYFNKHCDIASKNSDSAANHTGENK